MAEDVEKEKKKKGSNLVRISNMQLTSLFLLKQSPKMNCVGTSNTVLSSLSMKTALRGKAG